MSDDHWKFSTGEQHHARTFRLGLNWYEGNITKYAERCRYKGVWLDDVLKILDYTILYLESYEWDSPNGTQADKLKDMSNRLYLLSKKGQEFEIAQATKSYVDQG